MGRRHLIFSLSLLAAVTLSSTSAYNSSAGGCDATSLLDTTFEGDDLPGQPISMVLTAASECSAFCCSTLGCVSFSLGRGGPGTRSCFLKRRRSDGKADPGSESGVLFHGYTIDDTAQSLGPVFDGVGASFTGASARMLYDYPANVRTAALEFLFAQGSSSNQSLHKGVALQILRLEIGGDANTGSGSEPSYQHMQGDTSPSLGGWSGWLASAALALNPQIKVILSPVAFPGWLRFNALDAKTPWTDVVSVANYVVQYVFLFEATYGVQVYGLGVWGNKRTGIATTTAEQIKYVLYLRTTLDEQGLQRILIIASDQGDWATAAAMSDSTSPLFTPGLADAVGVVGNSGVDLVGTFVSQTGKPAWSTRMAVTDTTSTGAMNAVLDVLSGFVLSRGALSGWIADIGSSSTPYGFPQWHGGLLLAAQPLSGYVYPTPALWALAHITQFVPVGTRLLPVGSGSGTLQNGGFFVSWMDEVSKAWYLVIAKFGYPGSGAGSNVQRETATFTLGGSFANPVISVLPAYFSTFGYYSDQNCSEFNKLAGGITVSGSTFSVDLVSTGLYTITSQQDLNVHKGCQARDCPDRPPPPAPFGAHDIALCDSGNGAIVGDPGRLLVDVTGSFQCTDKLPVAPLVLAQVADGFPIGIGPDRDSRPHSLTGDLNMVDVDVSVSFAITSTFVTGTALYSTALLGARVSPFNVTASGTDPVVAMDTAPGVWLLATTDGQFLSWKLVLGLSPSLYAQPVAQGVTKAPFLLDRWATLRLIVRGRLAAGTFYQDPNTPSSSTAHNANANATRPDDSLLFMLDVAVLGAPSSGFLGIGSGEYFAGGVAFSDLNVRNTTGTCDGVPLENAQIAMEECQVGAPGLTFSFQRVDPNDANVGYNVFVGYDAEDEDTPGRTPLPGNTIDAYKAACTAMPECVAFNGNGWPKARLDDISPTGLTDLYVKQLPSGHLVLSANASLCATRDDGPATPILKLAACDATGTNVDQLFTIELTTTDGQWLTGPIASVRDNKVWDVYYSGESVDTQINVYGYTHGANQYFVLDNGLIRVIQLGQCAGACSWL